MKKELVLTNDPAEIGKIAPFVEEIGQELALTQKEVFNLNLALEEAAANVIHYAYADESGKTCSANEKKCRIKAEKAQGLLTLTLADRGKEFDPTRREDPDLSLPAEERPIGGLGIFLIKQLMDSVEYRREGGENLLILKKRLPQ